ncbi:hypothetical protein MY4824_005984 [Beauveria thailandica]
MPAKTAPDCSIYFFPGLPLEDLGPGFEDTQDRRQNPFDISENIGIDTKEPTPKRESSWVSGDESSPSCWNVTFQSQAYTTILSC